MGRIGIGLDQQRQITARPHHAEDGLFQRLDARVHDRPVGDGERDIALRLTQDLRRDGFAVDLGFSGNTGKRMKRADKLGCAVAILRALHPDVEVGVVARFEAQRSRFLRRAAKEKEDALALAAQFADLTLTIPQRVGESDRLYGSVTNAMIAEALEARGFAVDRKQLELPEPIKKLGSYQVTVRLAPEVKAQIQVEVVPEAS